MAVLKPLKSGYYVWHYVPSLPASVVFIILFLFITAAHGYKLYKFRLWFCIPFLVGGLMEVIGYIARAKAENETDKLMPYIVQSTFTLLPPVLFAASIYMVLGRIIRAARGEQYSLIRVARLTKTFVWGDVVSFFIQGSGAGLMAQGASLSSTGQWIVIGGLLVQIIMFGLFGMIAMVFHYRYTRYSVSAMAYSGSNWLGSLYMLYGVSLLIMVRSIFRVVEFVMGNDGYPMKNEWTLYIFDAVPMFIVMVVFYFWYPSKLQPLNQDTERVNSAEGLDSTDGVVQLYMGDRQVGQKD
ncbi:hypothetical protein JX265_000075 [Neoarthrinium moseri]|uniref:RTA1-domain-containing protein n=1 Tax=Neoarthrinium moseri TaxID=1658444 RepID=A0A9P9WY40_9PEZI|nr:uncharacterized protein JN550_001226 [Neoarthrinium moseri]KAI1845746.1 hypothetical protein JX266_008111 [Neoarthrinium moseri]KAI1877154.1 hypothetical protein JN550_001226 [Neoarthrinium moseri]KAI1881249.1 hypothetical protein JX265_000075 [Neoarthrinium moseri]